MLCSFVSLVCVFDGVFECMPRDTADDDAADDDFCWNAAEGGDADIRILPNDFDTSSALLLVVALDVLTSELTLDDRSVR